MYPFLLPDVFGYSIAMYDVMLMIGIAFMFIYMIPRFEKMDGFTHQETNRLLVLIAISLVLALFSSYLFDGIFHSIQEGEWSFGTITFTGGLIGGLASFLILYRYFYKYENKDLRKVLNTLITGVVLAHAFGRIGCFFAGCCFGIPTDGLLGIEFPFGHAHDLYPGEAVYPTQLFESFFLFVLFFALTKVPQFKNRETETYLIAYGVWRIAIEFIRGDDRGEFITLFQTEYNSFPTPSQYTSLLMVGLGIYLLYKHLHRPTIQNV